MRIYTLNTCMYLINYRERIILYFRLLPVQILVLLRANQITRWRGASNKRDGHFLLSSLRRGALARRRQDPSLCALYSRICRRPRVQSPDAVLHSTVKARRISRFCTVWNNGKSFVVAPLSTLPTRPSKSVIFVRPLNPERENGERRCLRWKKFNRVLARLR